MSESGIHAIQFISLVLLCSVVVFGALAKRLGIPYPILLMLAGSAMALLPGIPRVPLDPDMIFLVVLPPLLYAAAWQTSWREFRFSIVSILLLAFGLVGFTVFGVAYLVPSLLPGFTWTTAFVLGAVVSTTDAIAATAIGSRLGLPRRIINTLEGESLVNDASGLLALEFGLAMLVRGESLSFGYAAWRLFYLIAAGIGFGLVGGLIIAKLEEYIDDGPVELGISIVVPYGMYLGAEAIHASGVLAVVTAGLFLSRKSATFFSPHVRIQILAVWDTLVFLLNGFVFLLMGLQLPYIKEDIRGMNMQQALLGGLLFSLVLIVLRVLWMYPGSYLAGLIRCHIQKQRYIRPPARQLFIVGWTGMRGVVALAAAVSLPRTLQNGTPFAQRDGIIFLTFCVIFVTLVVQGLTLPALIRRLGVADTPSRDCEEEEARSIIIKAALKQLETLRKGDGPEFASVYSDLAYRYRARLFTITGESEDPQGLGSGHVSRFRNASRQMRAIERNTAIQLRNEGKINDELLHRLQRELDLIDLRTSLEPSARAM